MQTEENYGTAREQRCPAKKIFRSSLPQIQTAFHSFGLLFPLQSLQISLEDVISGGILGNSWCF